MITKTWTSAKWKKYIRQSNRSTRRCSKLRTTGKIGVTLSLLSLNCLKVLCRPNSPIWKIVWWMGIQIRTNESDWCNRRCKRELKIRLTKVWSSSKIDSTRIWSWLRTNSSRTMIRSRRMLSANKTNLWRIWRTREEKRILLWRARRKSSQLRAKGKWWAKLMRSRVESRT